MLSVSAKHHINVQQVNSDIEKLVLILARDIILHLCGTWMITNHQGVSSHWWHREVSYKMCLGFGTPGKEN